MNALITSTINNIFHGIWIGYIVMDPRHSRRKTALIVTGTVILFQMIVMAMWYMWYTEEPSYEKDMGLFATYFVAYLLAILIFGGIYIFVLSKSHPAKSLFFLSAYFCLWTLIYISISLVTGTFLGAGNIVIWSLRIGLNVFFLSVYLCVFRQRLIRICKEIKSGYGIVVTISVSAFTLMTLLIFYNQKMKTRDWLYMIIVFLICGFMMLVFLMLFRFIEQSAHVYHIKQIRFHEKFLMAQIDSYEKMEQNARQTRHDFRHHNMVVAEYAKNKDYQGILSYLNEYEKKEDEKYAVDFCKNQAVNNVLCAYVEKARQNKIDIKTDIRFVDSYGISDYDLVAILANILENAINACMKINGVRELEITINQKGYKLILICKNTCPADIVFENGLPQNKERDGIGVESILSAAAKYDGDVDFSASEEKFTCRVILNYQKTHKNMQMVP